MNKKIFGYITIAYLFSVALRFLLYFLAKSNPEFLYHSHIIPLWTADAGLYGHYAKELLLGHSVPMNNETMAGYLIYWIVKITHLNIDTVMFVLPAFLASLIVVPIILTMAEFGMAKVGFLASLAGAIGMNYYFRTHMGYTDTDMLNFVLFFTILYFMIALAKRQNILFGILAAVTMLLFMQWYHSAKALVFGSWLFYTIYLLVFERKNVSALLGALLMALVFIPLPLGYRFALVFIAGVVLWIAIKRFVIDYKIVLALFLVALLGASYVGYKRHMLDRAFAYFNKTGEYVLQDKSHQQIEITGTLKTVAEARGITLSQLVTYSSGSWIIFILGLLGIGLLIFKERRAILLLLSLGIGLLSIKTGVRFTTFAVPVIAIGFIYLFYFLSQKIQKAILAKTVFYIPSLLLLLFYINIMNRYNHMLSPFFIHDQVAAIDKNLNRADKGYILTWWDYGWPLWYYTNKRTIIDNGKHHYDNYIVAKTLFSFDQNFVANFDRFFVETYDRIYPWAVLPYVLHRWSFSDLIRGLREGTITLPKKRNEIYYYFDDKILDKLPVIENFSIIKGEKKRGFVWIDRLRVLNTSKGVLAGSGVQINLKNGELIAKQGRDRIGTIYIHDGKHITNIFRYRRNGYDIIVYKLRYIIGAYQYINSFFFQAFFFNNLDKKLYKTEHYDKAAKIFHLIGR